MSTVTLLLPNSLTLDRVALILAPGCTLYAVPEDTDPATPEGYRWVDIFPGPEAAPSPESKKGLTDLLREYPEAVSREAGKYVPCLHCGRSDAPAAPIPAYVNTLLQQYPKAVGEAMSRTALLRSKLLFVGENDLTPSEREELGLSPTGQAWAPLYVDVAPSLPAEALEPVLVQHTGVEAGMLPLDTPEAKAPVAVALTDRQRKLRREALSKMRERFTSRLDQEVAARPPGRLPGRSPAQPVPLPPGQGQAHRGDSQVPGVQCLGAGQGRCPSGTWRPEFLVSAATSNITTGYSVPEESQKRLAALAHAEHRNISHQFSHMLSRWSAPETLPKRRAGAHSALSLRQSPEDINKVEAAAKATGGSLSAVVTHVIDTYGQEG